MDSSEPQSSFNTIIGRRIVEQPIFLFFSVVKLIIGIEPNALTLYSTSMAIYSTTLSVQTIRAIVTEKDHSSYLGN